MGNRGSIQVVQTYKEDFGNKEERTEKSVVLFRHWGGSPEDMVELCDTAFIIMKKGYRFDTEGYASEVIALLTQVATKTDKSSAYLGISEQNGDNSDNGHYLLKIGKPHSKELHWVLEHDRVDIHSWGGIVVEEKVS